MKDKWKTMGRKEAEKVYVVLKEVIRISTMENANFSAELKEETRIWRQSWITSPLTKLASDLKDLYKLRN